MLFRFQNKEVGMFKSFSAIGILLFTRILFSATDPSEIVRSGEEKMRGDSTQVLMTMSVSHADYKRDLKLRSWTLGKNKSLVEILKPVKEEGVTSLRSATEMWNYLPKTDQVIRVPSSMMLQSWMGSDFTNDDLMKMSSLNTDYTHQLKGVKKLNGEDTYLIQCTPKKNAPVVWGKVLYWARTEDNLPVKEEFFDDKGVRVRTLHLSGFKQMDDRTVPTVLKIQREENPNESTTVTYEKILYNRAVTEKLFDKDSIRRTSQQGKRSNEGWIEEPLSPKTGETAVN